MTEARPKSLWHRTGAAAALGVVVSLSATTEGCSCSNDHDNPSSPATTSGTAGGGGGSGGTGSGGAGDITIEPVANGTDFNTPFDATPDPEGKIVYFTALDPAGEPGVFKVAAD